MNIIGFGVHPQDKWGDRSDSNVFRIDGLTADEWVEAGKGTHDEFWATRASRLAQGVSALFQNKKTNQAFPMDKFALSAHGLDISMQQIGTAMPEWDKLLEMSQKKTGALYGIDIETIGDIQNGKGVFGITEIGLSKIKMKDGVRETDAFSLALGLNEEQQKYVNSLITRYEHEGWNSLNKTERSTIQRASMYSGNFDSRFIIEGENGQVAKLLGNRKKGYAVVQSLEEASLDVDKMRKGVENLALLYNHGNEGSNTKAKNIMGDIMSFIDSHFEDGIVKDNRVIYAANAKFDIGGLRNYTKYVGVTPSRSLDALEGQILDTVNIIRSVSAISEQSVPRWMLDVYGVEGGADIESQMKVYGMKGTQLHHGDSDLINEARILINEDIDIYDVYRDLFKDEIVDKYTAMKLEGVKNNVYYMHHGTFVKDNADEFAYVSNSKGQMRAAPNYSITQEYWTINTERSGYQDINGDTKFRLVLDNYADAANGTPASIVLSGESVNEVISRFENMTNKYDKYEVSADTARYQQMYHYHDLGRREYEKMFSPSEVMVDNKVTINGYAAIQKNLATESLLEEWEEKNNRLLGRKIGEDYDVFSINGGTARDLYDAMEDIANEKADEYIQSLDTTNLTTEQIADKRNKKFKEYMFNSDYEAQSYLGMRAKLRKEKPLLQQIVNGIEDNSDTQNLSIADKTIIAKNAYEKVMGELKSQFDFGDDSSFSSYISDIHGLDIMSNEETRFRINAYDKASIYNGLTSKFKHLNTGEIRYSIDNLEKRHLIGNAKKYYDILDRADLSNKSAYENSLYFLAQDMSFEISKKIEKNGRENAILESIGTSLVNDMTGSFFDNGTRMRHEIAFNNHKGMITRSINDAIINMTGVTYHNGTITDAQIDDLLSHLNMDGGTKQQIDSKHNIVRSMFTGGSEGKSYGINKHKGVQVFLVNNPGETSSYMFFSKDKDAQKLYENLQNKKYKFDSYREMLESGANEYGGFIELPYLHKYYLNEEQTRYMTTVKQGNTIERFLVPELNVRISDDNGKKVLKGYMNGPEHSILTLFQRYGGSFLDDIDRGEYSKATRAARRALNKELENKPLSSSYRNIGRERKMSFGPSDYLHSEEYYIQPALDEIFHFMVTGRDKVDENNLNIAQKIVKHFGVQSNIDRYVYENGTRRRMSFNQYAERIMRSSTFKQFMHTRASIGTLADDELFKNAAFEGIDKPIIEIIRDAINNDAEYYGFDRTLVKAFESVKPASMLNPVLAESATNKGAYSTIKPGEFSFAGGLYSPMRPLYTQQNNGIPFDYNRAVSEVDELFKGLGSSIMYGLNPLEQIEYDARNALLTKNHIQVGERNFASYVKFMPEYELQTKIRKLRKSATFKKSIMSDYGVSNASYDAMMDYLASSMFSMHEDKGFIAPGMKATALFQARESMKFELNMDIMDEEKTKEALDLLLNKKINKDNIIGIKKNGQAVFYNGPEAILSQDNIDDILYNNDGVTKLSLTRGGIVDDKLIVNGGEKLTIHAMDAEDIGSIFGVDNKTAIEIGNRFFGKISDGAPIVMNPKSSKHGGIHTANNIFLVAEKHYIEAGKGNQFVNYLNSLVNTKYYKSITGGLDRFSFDGKRVIGTMANAEHGAAFIDRIYSDIVDNANESARVIHLDSKINKAIIKELDYMKENNLSLVIAQRQSMTEFVGKKFRMDTRADQSIRFRGMHYSQDGLGVGIDENNAMIADAFREYSMKYDATSKTLADDGLHSLQQLTNAFSIAKNEERIRYNSPHKDMQRSIGGIIETVNQMRNPFTSKSVQGKHIVQFDIDDLIDPLNWGGSGASTEQLQSSIFFVDGSPSKLLAQKAAEQSVDLNKANSIFINLKRNIKVNDNITDGFMIPIQTISGAVNGDEHYFQNNQKLTTKAINKVVAMIEKPSLTEDFAIDAGKIIEEYATELSSQLNYMNKDADITKAFQQYIVPTSQYLLGQDEVSPLLASQLRKDNLEVVRNKERLESDLADLMSKRKDLPSDSDIQKAIDLYDDALYEFNKMLRETADGIDSQNAKFSQYSAISAYAQKKFGDAMKVKGPDGRMHHGMGLAVSAEALERNGFDFGVTAMNLVADIEKTRANPRYRGNYEKIEKFANLHSDKLDQLRKKLNGLDLGGGYKLEIDDGKALMPQIELMMNDILGKVTSWDEISTKTLNEEIAKGAGNSAFLKVLGVFKESGIAQDYMSEIGTYGQFFRSPIFRSQPLTKVLYDSSLRGNQGRVLDATNSMTTNLDFDGDTHALLLMLDGTSIMKKSDAVWQAFDKEWKRYAIQDQHHLLADLVREGAPFRKELSFAMNYQQSALLKIADKEAYNRGLQAFIDNHNIKDAAGNYITDVSQLTEAMEFAAQNSKEMTQIFEETLGNTMRNDNMTIAALAARMRKELIGAVSTPEHKLRSTFMDVLRSPSLTDDQKILLNDTLVSLTNMFSQAGGFASVAEQKGIDTKFAEDALRYSKLGEFAGALTSLIEKGKNNPHVQYNSVYKMIETVGQNVFGINSQGDYEKYTDIALNTDTEFFREAYQDTRNGIRDKVLFDGGIELKRDEIQQLWALHDLTRSINEVPELSKVFVGRYKDEKSAIDFTTNYANLSEAEKIALKKQVKDSPVSNIIPIIEKSLENRNIDFNIGEVYYATGSLLDKKPGVELYQYTGEGLFAKVNLSQSVIIHRDENGSIVKSSKTLYGVNKQSWALPDSIVDKFMSQNAPMISDLRHMPDVRDALNAEIESTMIANTLDRAVLSKSGKIKDLDHGPIQKLIQGRHSKAYLKAIGSGSIKRGNDTLDALADMVNNADMNQVRDYAIAYDKAIALGATPYQGYDNSADLIRALNKKIADEGWKDTSGINVTYYDVMLRPHVMDALGGESNFKRYLDIAVNIPDFNNKDYSEALDSLYTSVYDIHEARNTITSTFATAHEELDTLRYQGRNEEDLSPLVAFLDKESRYTKDKINEIQMHNVGVASTAEATVYSMLRDKEHIDKHFGFGEPIAKDDVRVGFGEFMGKSFSELSNEDISYIMSADVDTYGHGLNKETKELLGHAIEQTQKELEGYTTARQTSAFHGTAKIHDISGQIESQYSNIASKVMDSVEHTEQTAREAAKETSEKMGEQAAEGMKKQTLKNELYGSLKDGLSSLNISGKTVGMVAGAMAALGIINGLVHGNGPQSPLVPGRTSKNNNDPYLKNKEVEYDEAPATPKGSKTVYHHRGSGLNFKVTAKTKNQIDAQNNAKLIGLAGGKNPSIHSYADTSGINNNWLENKFAELMN